jgi:hypothetical protein
MAAASGGVRPRLASSRIIGIMYRKGRFPETKYVTPDGKPIFTAAQLAEHLDLTVEDIHFHIGLFHSQGILVIPPPSEDDTPR